MAKNNFRKKQKSTRTSKPKIDDYDLKKSLHKLKQQKGKNIPNSETSTNFQINKSQSPDINQSILNKNSNTETSAIYFKLNESFNTRYDNLNDSIQNVNDRIGNTNSDLRQELETKIGEKLETKFFLWTIGALIVITTLIYTLSYSNLASETGSNSGSVKSIKKDLDIQKEDIKELENDIEKIETKQRKIEIELIKHAE